MKNFTSALVAFLLINTASFSQAGSLDSSFSEDGIVKTYFLNDSRGTSVAIQLDGKIIAAGSTANGRNYDFAVARYLPNGMLDTSFGANGQVITGFKGDDIANSVAIQADGKIVIAGTKSTGSHQDFALVRYRPDGKPDNAFGENGEVTTDFGFDDFGNSVAIQPDGKIIVAGRSGVSFNYDFALARYRQDGKPDSGFGTNGKVTTDFFGHDDGGYSVAIQSDGKILVTGYAYNGSNYNFLLIRYKQNGGLDSAFGTNGKITTDFEPDGGIANSVAIQSNGKIVVAGYTSNGSSNDFAVVRYKPNGNLDSLFGNNGKVITDLGSYDNGRSVAIQADGKIVVAGAAGNNFALVRYRHDGRPDNAFGIKGKVITDLGSNGEEGNSLTIQLDGKIVVGGYSGTKYAILRYNGDNTSVNKFSNFQKQNNTSSTIHQSPNPAKDILHIEGLTSSSKTISILDAKGKLLQQTTTANANYSFSVKQLAAGMYFIRIDEGDKTNTLKFIKE